jgi:hypothetical protein
MFSKAKIAAGFLLLLSLSAHANAVALPQGEPSTDQAIVDVAAAPVDTSAAAIDTSAAPIDVTAEPVEVDSASLDSEAAPVEFEATAAAPPTPPSPADTPAAPFQGAPYAPPPSPYQNAAGGYSTGGLAGSGGFGGIADDFFWPGGFENQCQRLRRISLFLENWSNKCRNLGYYFASQNLQCSSLGPNVIYPISLNEERQIANRIRNQIEYLINERIISN